MRLVYEYVAFTDFQPFILFYFFLLLGSQDCWPDTLNLWKDRDYKLTIPINGSLAASVVRNFQPVHVGPTADQQPGPGANTVDTPLNSALSIEYSSSEAELQALHFHQMSQNKLRVSK